MRFNTLTILLIAILLPCINACSVGQIVARTSESIMDGNIEAMNRETDLELAESAIPANIKLVEGLIIEDPRNETLLVSAAQALYGYAFGFVELDHPQRALGLYSRGAEYGVRALRTFGLTVDLMRTNQEELDRALAGLNKRALPALFWTASNWAKLIDLDRTDPARIAELSIVERLMHRAKELDADFYFGGIYLFYGVYYGGRAPMLGGNLELAEQNFTAARKVTDNRLLIVDVLQAEYLERQRFDVVAFKRLLNAVIATPVGSFEDMALANQIARQRAKILLQKEHEWF